jgi:hypothetical protein
MDSTTIRARLEHSAAQELLGPDAPLARIAFVAPDGTPRVIPVGLVWQDEQLLSPSQDLHTSHPR